MVGPSSYVYLDASRPVPGASCTADGGCQFTPYPNAGGCSAYDSYFMGWRTVTGYVGVPSAAEVQAEYVRRNVSYLVGDEDTLANAEGTNMDTSCEADSRAWTGSPARSASGMR